MRIRSLLLLTVLPMLPVLRAQSVQSLLLPDLLDLRPTAARLQSRLDELTAEANLQASLGNQALAAQITAVVATLTAQAAGTLPAPVSPSGLEFHVVSFYEGFGATSSNPGSATVEVDRPGSAVALVLNAYEPINWTITQTPNTTVLAVISYSYEPQTLLTGGLPGVPVVQLSYTANQNGDFWGVVGDVTDPVARLRANAWCIENLGAFAATFVGDYSAPSGTFVVGEATADWREQWVIEEALRQGATFNNGTRAQLQASVQAPFLPIYTAAGSNAPPPVVALASPLQTLAPLVTLPAGITDYAIGNSFDLYALRNGVPSTLSLATLQTTPIPANPSLPPFSFVNTMTFDSNRNRLLVSGFGGGANLYAYAVATGTWSLLSQPAEAPHALAYHPLLDATFALRIDVYATVPYELQRYDDNGNLVGSVPIALPVIGDSLENHQLYAYGTGLVYVGPARTLLGFPVRQCFVVDPVTGDVLCATFLLG